MMNKFLSACLIAAFFSFYGNIKAGAEEIDVPRQIQKLDENARKFTENYSKQKTEIESQLQNQLQRLSKSAGDRARRRELMIETNQKLLMLKESFKLNMDSIQEAKNKLNNTEPISSLPALTQPSESSPLTDLTGNPQVKQPQESLKERIQRQDEQFQREKALAKAKEQLSQNSTPQ